MSQAHTVPERCEKRKPIESVLKCPLVEYEIDAALGAGYTEKEVTKYLAKLLQKEIDDTAPGGSAEKFSKACGFQFDYIKALKKDHDFYSKQLEVLREKGLDAYKKQIVTNDLLRGLKCFKAS